MIQWGERSSAMGDALRGTAEMSEARLRFQSIFLETVTLPIVLILVALSVGFLIVGLFLPLISLIQKLS